MKKFFALVAICGLAVSAHASCYSVYNGAGRLVYQSTAPPVDTTYQYHSTVPQRFGQGSSLVYVRDMEGCQAVGSLGQVSTSESSQVRATNTQRQGRPPKADRG
jgi:hypothetical protein